MNDKRPFVGMFSALILLLVVASGIYFFALRTPDSSYADTLRQLDTAQAQAASINTRLASIHVATDVTQESVDELLTDTDKFSKTIELLGAEGLATVRDAEVKKVYDQQQATLVSFSQKTTSLIQAMSVFQKFTDICGDLTDKLSTIDTVGAFDAASKDCSNAIKQIQSTSGTLFDTQFLEGYAVLAPQIIEVDRQLVAAKGNESATRAAIQNLLDLQQKIAPFAKSTQLDLKITTPKDSLEKIKNITESQQKKLFR